MADAFIPLQGRRRREVCVLWTVLVLGALARVLLHSGVTYSPADEQVYVNDACAIGQHGLTAYPDLVRTYLGSATAQLYPSPMRWGYVLPAAVVTRIGGCGAADLAWIQTAAGIVMLGLVAGVASRLGGTRLAIVATALVAASPLQLHLGRRALEDELVGALGLAALWAVLWYVDRPTWRRIVVPVVAITAGLATKELFVLLYPALMAPIVLAWLRRRAVRAREVVDVLVVFLVPPLVCAGVFILLAWDPHAYLDVLRDVVSSAGGDYGRLYQSGPPYRLLLDLFILAPAVVALALAGLGLLLDRGTTSSRLLAAVVLLSVVPYSLVAAKSVRYVVTTDALVCLLAAWAVVTALRSARWWWTGAVTLLVVASEVAVFWAVSIRGGVYDPVTDNLLRSLHIIP